MATKLKKTTKPAAPAGKKIAPLILTGPTARGTGFLHRLEEMPAVQLKELLRARGVPIPKSKDEMVDRLYRWFSRDGGTHTLTLG